MEFSITRRQVLCDVFLFRVGDDLPGVPKTNKFPHVKNNRLDRNLYADSTVEKSGTKKKGWIAHFCANALQLE